MSRPLPSLRQMLEDLIATPSVSSSQPDRDQSNLPLLELLATWLDDAGFDVEIAALPGRPDKANLIATLGGGPGGLVLAGHADTVPFDGHLWQHDPLRLTEDGDRLYGLGTSDMKSFFALAIEATRGLAAETLRQPLTILATADEESAMHGAHALLDAGRPLGRYALIGEPTGLRPVRLNKGVMGEAIRLIGRSGHASDPSLGIDALEGMHAILSDLFAWRDALATHHRHPAFAIPYPTISPGYIHGGDNANRICGECQLHLDLRLLPGLTPEALRAELEARVATVAAPRGLQWEVAALFPSIPPAETPADSAIVEAAEALTGRPAEAVNFGTEAFFFNRLGLETVVLGPGDIAQAHQPDEYLESARIAPMIELLQGLIHRFCIEVQAGQEGPPLSGA